MPTHRTRHPLNMLCAALLAASLGGCSSLGLWGSSQEAAPAAEAQPAPDDGATAALSRNAQAPGFFRMRMGTITVTALYDGNIDIGSKLLKGRSQAAVNRLLQNAKQPADVPTAVNAFLLDDGKNVVLVDAGAGSALGASMGRLRDSLAASGYAPDNVTAILLTHLHPDHVGGLVDGEAMAFPNAQVYAPQTDADYWLSDSRLKGEQPYFQGTQKALAPYQAGNRFHTFAPGQPPIEGFSAVALPGHTPGHTGYLIRSDGESILIWGDVVHSQATQFADPTIALEFDIDQKAARATRLKTLQSAAQTGQWIAGAHLPFPGIGRVQAMGKNSYRWLPIDYSQAMSDASQRQPRGKR